jgi:hypothetical protein
MKIVFGAKVFLGEQRSDDDYFYQMMIRIIDGGCGESF